MRTYEKPTMTRHALVSEAKVANTCWGFHAGGSPTWWYDKNGKSAGFVSFYIGEGSKCGEVSNMLHVTWYQNRAALDAGEGKVVFQGNTVVTDAGDTVTPFDDTVEYLVSMGGNNGNPFSGENNLIEDNTHMS